VFSAFPHSLYLFLHLGSTRLFSSFGSSLFVGYHLRCYSSLILFVRFLLFLYNTETDLDSG
jgi:hypothetical protein